MLVQGDKFAKLAEGVPTAAAMMALGKKYGVELPITEAVYEVCYGEGDMPYEERCKKAMAKFFIRETKTEFYS
jgi:glycerol-3-phosphate dehydrogenase (NAD(P)+)